VAARFNDTDKDFEARFTALLGAKREVADGVVTLTLQSLDGSVLPSWQPGDKLATRVASGKVLAAIYDVVPGLIGGGADLSGNTGRR